MKPRTRGLLHQPPSLEKKSSLYQQWQKAGRQLWSASVVVHRAGKQLWAACYEIYSLTLSFYMRMISIGQSQSECLLLFLTQRKYRRCHNLHGWARLSPQTKLLCSTAYLCVCLIFHHVFSHLKTKTETCIGYLRSTAYSIGIVQKLYRSQI